MLRAKLKKVAALVLSALTILSSLVVGGISASAATTNETTSGVSSTTVSTVTNKGEHLSWGNGGGVYYVNGDLAFCFNNHKTGPSNNSQTYYYKDMVECTNVNVIRTLYYGFGGPATSYSSSISSENGRGYLVTRSLASYYYCGSSYNEWKTEANGNYKWKLKNIVESSSADPSQLKFSKTNLTFKVATRESGNYLKTETIQLVSKDSNVKDSNAYLQVKVPSNLWLVNDSQSTSSNKVQTGPNGTATIKSGEKFHFECSVANSGNYTVGAGTDKPKVTSAKVYVAKPKNGSLQPLGVLTYTTEEVNMSLNISAPKIKLQLQKKSADTSITDGNDCYSLEGAIYDIYTDKNCNNYFSYIKTNSSGFGKYGAGENGADVEMKTYYARERKNSASPGYAVDDTVYEFKSTGEVADGSIIYKAYDTNTKKFELLEQPQNDPVDMILSKTGVDDEKLAGAQFTVNYYDSIFSTENELSGKTPTRSWVFQTGNGVGNRVKGEIHYTPDYRISGDDLYYVDHEGQKKYCIPLGTITIQETKAPDGYVID